MLSGALTAAAFPPLEYSPLAWIGLAPLVWISLRSPPAESARSGFFWGFGFWILSIAWLRRVSPAGWLALAVYCSLYSACFAAASSLFSGLLRVPLRRAWPLCAAIGVPALWTAFEYLRSTLFTGFPWNQLGVSQYRNIPLIQCAGYGGVYAVSFLAVAANTALALAAAELPRPASRAGLACALAAVAALLGVCGLSGAAAAARFKSHGHNALIAAVQPNIPQYYKWSEEFRAFINQRLKTGTQAALAGARPDLVVWPETSVPDYIREPSPSLDLVDELLQAGTPMLVGGMDYGEKAGEFIYYNSSFLFMPDRSDPAAHAKLHLVMFGEYVPFADIFPFLRRLTPIEENFSSGGVFTVFDLPVGQGRNGHAIRFSALICFEDTVPSLARAFVRKGARLLINQTNDAWFDPSSASRQHMAHCVFRCVENRVPAVRAANTGVTCAIDRNGEVIAAAPRRTDGAGSADHITAGVYVPGADMPLAFYTRRGDVLAVSCVALALAVAAAGLATRKGSVRT